METDKKDANFNTIEPLISTIDWRISQPLVDYESALKEMETRVNQIISGQEGELIWLLEHPPLYTAGTSAQPEDLINADRFPIYRVGRGGQYTYHGPGQRIVYVMLDLRRRKPDVRAFIQRLENWIIETLKTFGVTAEIRQGRVGVWVKREDIAPGREDKIAAIGIRMRRWVSFHGLSLNVAPTLEHYSGIVPCGIKNHGVTSLADLGINVTMSEVDKALRDAFEKTFGERLL